MVKSPVRLLCFLLLFLVMSKVSLAAEDLMSDLMIVDAVNCRLNKRLPVYMNNLFQGGYINMPSALMGAEGEMGVGFSSVPPYYNYNLRLQYLDRLELSFNYRVFRGVDDPILSCSGFGDKSDKGANIKYAILHPKDSDFVLPGVAFGFEDFLGTKSFEAFYIVFTKVFREWNVECSVGYGQKRINGFFGGATWFPFFSRGGYLRDLALVMEYDAIDYHSKKKEPHPDGREQKSPVNFGVKYRLWDLFDFSAGYVRGKKFSYAFSTSYNFGNTCGFFPKIRDPLPCAVPWNTSPMGPLRPQDQLAEELSASFCAQGFSLQEVWLTEDCYGRRILRLHVVNCSWRYEDVVRTRLNELVARQVPENIDEVIVVLQNDALQLQELRYQMPFVRGFERKEICPYELAVITPFKEVSRIRGTRLSLLYKKKWSLWDMGLFPKTYTAFGSAKGKFKYLAGVHFNISGTIGQEWFYSLLFGYTINSTLCDVSDIDRLNPSRIINVRTDTVNYFKESRFTVDEAYVQKCTNLGRGLFHSFSFGLFEFAYGGVATEFLYYPVDSCLAVGIEGAYLRKREYTGVGFTDRARKLKGCEKIYEKFHPNHLFANLYYHFDALDMTLAVKAGKFLAKDWGIRTELSRHYPSGMRFFFWYTYTDAKDYVNGHRYFDKGVGFSMPLDIFLTYSSRKNFGYAMSAWLRDVGAIAWTGEPLYYKIREEREKSIQRCRF